MRLTDRRHVIYNQWGKVRDIIYAPSIELALLEAELLQLEPGERLRAVLAREADARIKAQTRLMRLT